MGLRQGGWTEAQFAAVFTEVYRRNYSELVGLAAIIVKGPGEDVVQDATERVWCSWLRICEADKILLYWRRAVINGATAEWRHRRVVDRLLPGLSTGPPRGRGEGRPHWSPGAAATDEQALSRVADSAIVSGLGRLSRQQAACVVLRYYLELSVEETAEVLGCKSGSVKKQTFRALRRLQSLLEGHDG